MEEPTTTTLVGSIWRPSVVTDIWRCLPPLLLDSQLPAAHAQLRRRDDVGNDAGISRWLCTSRWVIKIIGPLYVIIAETMSLTLTVRQGVLH